MDRPKSFLNPNAAPFIPKFKGASQVEFKEENIVAKSMFCDSAIPKKTGVHEALDPACQPHFDATERLMISHEDFLGKDYQEQEDHVPQYETMGVEKQDLENSSRMASEYLSSLFPNFSLESVNEVYCACGDVVEAKLMLEQLEGYDDDSFSLPYDLHFTGTASSSFHNSMLSDSVSQPDPEGVQQTNSANVDSA